MESEARRLERNEKMRRKDRERDEEFAIEVVDSAPYGVVSFVDEKGEPYCVQLSLVRIGRELFFHSAHEGRKVDIIRNNPKACIAFADNVLPAMDQFTTGYDSAIVKGVVSEVTNDREKIEVLRKISEHFCPTNMERFNEAIRISLHRCAIFKISMDEITGKQKKLSPAE